MESCGHAYVRQAPLPSAAACPPRWTGACRPGLAFDSATLHTPSSTNHPHTPALHLLFAGCSVPFPILHGDYRAEIPLFLHRLLGHSRIAARRATPLHPPFRSQTAPNRPPRSDTSRIASIFSRCLDSEVEVSAVASAEASAPATIISKIQAFVDLALPTLPQVRINSSHHHRGNCDTTSRTNRCYPEVRSGD